MRGHLWHRIPPQAKAQFAANVRAILALARWREVESPQR
jgi:hypothetical protein